MTEISETTAPKKKNNFLIKLVIFLAVAFFSYLGFNHWKSTLTKKILAQHEAQKFDNVESDIFDLSSTNEEAANDNLTEMNVNALKEKGAEFIYHLLLKNQTQISDLSSQIQAIQGELTKYKNHERIGKMILSYVELRQEIFGEKNYENSLKSFEVLAALDENLPNKIERLKTALPAFSTKEKLERSFSALIPDLIIAKNSDPTPSLLSKVRRNISKLVIIRKIDGKDTGEIDSKVVQIEKLLKEENYQSTLNYLLSLDQNYHDIVANFLNDLSVAIEVQKIDQEILTYLKSLT